MAQNNPHMFHPQMSIFIPSVTASTTEKHIQTVFENLHIGVVSRVDFVEKDGNHHNSKYMAFVHFEYWFFNNSSYHLQERIVSHGQGKIVYNDPYYWIVMENKNPRTKGEIILEQRVKYLETVIAMHTRKFIENEITTKTYTCSNCWTTTLEEFDNCPSCDYTEVTSPQQTENDATFNEANDATFNEANDATFDEANALAMTGVLDSTTGHYLNSYTNDELSSQSWWPWT